MVKHRTRLETYSLLLYFVLAYFFSWVIGIPLALKHQGLVAFSLPDWAHYFVSYGPLLAAVVVTALEQGGAGLKRLGLRMWMWKADPAWWLVAISPLLVGALAALVVIGVTGQSITISSLGNVNFLPPLGLAALPLWLFTFGIGEETGWRGFALPRLQRSRSALSASLILSIVWALWHLPQFFYLFDPSIAIGWFLGLVCGAIVFTWLFNSTGGSILLVAVWHGCFNFISASDAGNGILAAVVSTLVMVWAVVLVFWLKPQNLSTRPKTVHVSMRD